MALSFLCWSPPLFQTSTGWGHQAWNLHPFLEMHTLYGDIIEAQGSEHYPITNERPMYISALTSPQNPDTQLLKPLSNILLWISTPNWK